MVFPKRKTKRETRYTYQSAAPVVRYYKPEKSVASRQAIDKPRVENESSQLRLWHTISRFVGVVIILLLLGVNTTLNGVSVKTTASSSAAAYRSLNEYEAIITKEFNSSVFNKNKLTMSSSKLEASLREKLPEVSAVSVVVPLAGRRLVVHLRMNDPFARLLLTGNQQAIITSSGVVVAINSAEKIQSKFHDLPAITLSSLSPKEGQQVLTSSELDLLRLMLSEFDGSSSARSKVENIEYDIKKREMIVRFEDYNYFAKMTPEREARVQVGSLVATIASLESESKVPSEYIDVRVDGRVFVK